MKRLAFIWKESIYSNGFKCKCGNQLADPKTGTPKGYVLVDEESRVIYCNKCKSPVCCYGEMETDLEAGMHGNIEEVFRTGN